MAEARGGELAAPGALPYAAAVAAILTAALGFVLAASTPSKLGDSATSRLATVYSLAHHGTWVIAERGAPGFNPFEPMTVDKAEIGGRRVSTKPPLMPLLMTGEYLVLRHALGWSLDEREDWPRIVRAMNWTFSGLPYLGLILLFAIMASWHIRDWRVRAAAVFSLAFATQLWAYSHNLNNHMPGAFLTATVAFLTLGIAGGKIAPRPVHFLLFGLAGGLLFSFDMPATIYFAAAGLYLLYRHPRNTMLWGGMGLALPLAVHFGVMTLATGSPMPLQTRGGLYLFQDSYWRNPLGIDALNEPHGTYLFHMTFGRFGTFLLFPVLLAGVAGFILAAFQREPWRGAILAGGAAFVLLNVYYVLKTDNYGGASYGFRWHIASMPVLLLMGAPVWNRMRGPAAWGLFALLLAVSCYSAWECMRDPWEVHREWTVRLIFGPAYASEGS